MGRFVQAVSFVPMFAVGSVGRTHKRLVRHIDGPRSIADPLGFALLQRGTSAADGDELLIFGALSGG